MIREARRIAADPAAERTILAIGVALRILEWARYRSFWIDEATLALNLVKRGYGGLLAPLDGDQAAPPGFLIVAKLCFEFFGNNELSLRLAPMAAGVGSVLVMALVVRRVFEDPLERLTALTLFALAGGPVYYCGEFKQYSLDPFVTLIGLRLALDWRRNPDVRRTIMLGAAFATLPWFSHAALFAFAGFGVTLAIDSVAAKDMRRAAACGSVGMAAAISFAALYGIALHDLSASEALRDYWRAEGGFMPLTLSPADLGGWGLSAVRGFFTGLPLLHAFTFPGFGLFAAGIILGLRDSRVRFPVVMAVSPLPVLLAASAAEAYPFADRFLLFLHPLAALIIACGIVRLAERAEDFSMRRGRPASAIAIALILVGVWLIVRHPAGIAINPALYRDKSPWRPAIRFAAATAGPEDRIYYHGPASVLSWYGTRYGPATYGGRDGAASFKGWDDRWTYAIHTETELREWAERLLTDSDAEVLWCLLPDSRPQRRSIRGEEARDALEAFGESLRVGRYGDVQIVRIDRRD